MMKSIATKAMLAAGAASVAMSAVSAPAEALSLTPYTDRAMWEADLNTNGFFASPTETFDNDKSNAPSITFDNGVVSTTDLPASTTNRVLNGEYNGDVINSTFAGVSQLTWEFPIPTLGFGADFSSVDSLEITIGDHTVPVSNGFFGVIANTAFSSVVFSNPVLSNDNFRADNLSYAEPIPTPAAVLPGLMSMGVAAFRKRRGEATEAEA